MTNKPIKSLRYSLVFFAMLFSGCASVGDNFPYQEYQSLELGKSSNEDYRVVFGNPQTVTSEDTDDGRFEIVNYIYGKANLGSAGGRALILEYKDGLLNSYIYASSFKEEKPVLDIGKLTQIERRVSTIEHALQILGEPSGMAICPSKSPSFKNRCESVEEVYAWSLVERAKSQSVFLGINSDGIVDRVEEVVVDDESNGTRDLLQRAQPSERGLLPPGR